jgi:predicted O-methyltransferase YrrM
MLKSLNSMLPSGIKDALRPALYHLITSPTYQKLQQRIKPTPSEGLHRLAEHKSPDEVVAYWRNPEDAQNVPAAYLEYPQRSQFLTVLMKKHVSRNGEILEIGCNIGRNLSHLYDAGYTHLNAIEINAKAIQQLRQTFPEVAAHLTLHEAPVEEVIPTLGDNAYEAVYTMAVLQHIHQDSDWIFPHIARIARRVVITIEEEKRYSAQFFPRDYKAIFEGLGFSQAIEVNCAGIVGLGHTYTARVFHKQS